MQVHKFGGASISTVDRFRQVAHIVNTQVSRPSVLVVSAMGKTTNALEKVAEAFFEQRQADALLLFEQVKNQHLTLAKYLLVVQYNPCTAQLSDFFTEAEWLLHDTPVREYNYYYDQLVSIGELLSSTLLSFYLKEEKIDNQWLDVRDILRTDASFRAAVVDWDATSSQLETEWAPVLAQTGIIVTQGFIGCTTDNETTTLGREGSDYSAAIFAHVLEAESQTIWKDVPSVMNADPKQFPQAVPIPHLSYEEVIEMAYYGAQVIHPKTIKPLYQKKIPLQVKCFLDPALPGTVITRKKATDLPPIIVKKDNQVMLEFLSRDYSFIGDHSVGLLFQLFETAQLQPNLTQNGAIRFWAVFDNNAEKIQYIASQAEQWLDVMVQNELVLLTIRHYHNHIAAELLGNKQPLLQQLTPQTAQYLVHK